MQEQEQRESLGILIGKVDVQFLPFAISIGDIQLVPPGGPGLLGGLFNVYICACVCAGTHVQFSVEVRGRLQIPSS